MGLGVIVIAHGFTALNVALPAIEQDFNVLGAAGLGNAMGPLLGGVLTDELTWRWIFFLNVPISAFAVLVTWLKVHQPQPEEADRRIDYGGIATLSLGLLLLMLALDQAADWGFGDPRGIA